MNDHKKYDIETGEELIRDVRPMTITYKGHSLTFDMPGWYPKSNDEGTFTDDDLKTYDRAINHLKAEAEHLLLPDEIRAIRKKLKLTQIQAGTLLGGGKKPFKNTKAAKSCPAVPFQTF